MELPILYEDDQIIVINKPPGIVVNRAESVKFETVQDWAEARLADFLSKPELPEEDPSRDFYDRAGIVHRIDKETSGCLLIAKDPATFLELQRQFKERIIKKKYRAIVHGAVRPEIGEIRAPVGRLPWNRERFGILPQGKDAVTKYSVLRTVASPHGKEELTEMELYPETGRTHQIRVHLKYINHPIVGDWQYAGRKTSRSDRLWAGRVLLHAYFIEFVHPKTSQSVAITAPVPDDMKIGS